MITEDIRKAVDHDQTQTRDQARWTVMVYFAADNDLDDEALANLKQIKKVGSTDDVKIVAQLDSRGAGKTFRYLLHDEETTLEEDIVGDPLPEVNTGDPRELTNFIRWGMKDYPADHTMLVLWGHGHGWESFDNSDRAAAPTTDRVLHKDKFNGEFVDFSIGVTNRREIRPFWSSERGKENFDKIMQSGKLPPSRYVGSFPCQSSDIVEHEKSEIGDSIGFLLDLSPGSASGLSQDVLKMNELSEALKNALAGCDKSRIDILGMDACLMGMVEVGYQVQEYVDYLVASEDTIPDESWPYDRILQRLVKFPDICPDEFSVTIVREYLLHYRDESRDVAKCVCDLSQSKQLVYAIEALATELMKGLAVETDRCAILASRAMTQTFYIRDYVDLYHFCSNLRLLSQNDQLITSCTNVMNIIRRDNGEGNKAKDNHGQDESQSSNFVHEYGYIGHRLRDANGVSIYFPCIDPSPRYADLPFAKDSLWNQFLTELAELFPHEIQSGQDAGESSSAIGSGGDSGIKAGAGTEQKAGAGTEQKVPLPLRFRVPASRNWFPYENDEPKRERKRRNCPDKRKKRSDNKE